MPTWTPRLPRGGRPGPVSALAVISFLLAASPARGLDVAEVAIGPVGPDGDLEGATIDGPEARLQLVATAKTPSGGEADVTAGVVWSARPRGVVSVSTDGLVTPLADGEAVVSAVWEDLERGEEFDRSASARITVRDFAGRRPVDFPDRVVSIFTKHGCNGGGCHGKSGGQNGFRLSLLGFYPRDDHEYLVKEGRGRRVSVAAPDRSLLLLKATNAVPHGGGERFDEASHEYRLIYRWMRQGMPYGAPDGPTVERIEVFPRVRRMTRDGEQQLRVLARLSDGSVEDVTRAATFESNDAEMATVDEAGRVRTLDLPGEVAVMVRYLGSVDVFRAIIPLGVEVESFAEEPRNFIDELVFEKWRSLGVPPSPVCDDATFLRRVTIDIAGRIPTFDEATAFAADESEDRRDRAIERLLSSRDYAEYFANKWSAILRNRRENDRFTRGTYAFHAWLRDAFHQGRPWDEVVRDVLAASGDMARNPPVAWYRAVATQEQRAEDSAQLFLGLRIQCARCHHHPFERWSQGDYYSYMAFFSQVRTKPNRDGRPDENRIFHEPGRAQARNPRTGEMLAPAGLGAPPLDGPTDEDPRHELVDWMVDPENPFFARSLVNRYWKHFFGRGLVEPEDDLRVTNPASHPELLRALAQHFIDSGFDLRSLVREICRSRVYQRSPFPNEHNARDKQSFARFYPKRLHAEVLYDAVHDLTGMDPSFGGLPSGTRAVELPDTGVNNYFLTVFGRPAAESSCECERSNDASLAQSLHLLNSKDILAKISSDQGRAARLAKDDRPLEARIGELYWRAFARAPSEEELAIARGHVESHDDARVAFEDIVWALLNTKEFLFNH